MNEIKYFEVRDRMTTVSAMCVQMDLKRLADRDYKIARHAGYSADINCILFHPMHENKINYDQYEWGGARTYVVAHNYIIENWDTLKSGDIVDVEFILGERDKPKETDL